MALKNLVQLYDAVVAHPLPHDIHFHEDVLPHRLAPSPLLEDLGGILQTRSSLGTPLHYGKLTPAFHTLCMYGVCVRRAGGSL